MWWHNAISQILYCLRYVTVLDDRAAFDMSQSIVAQRCLTDGPQSYLEAIEAGLSQHDSVCVVPTPHPESIVRHFLHALATELRRQFPWPFPAVMEVQANNWSRLLPAPQPIGKIELRQLDVSQRLGFEFSEVPGRDDPGLLLRLRTGAIIGLLAPTQLSNSGVAIFVSEDTDIHNVLNDIGALLAVPPHTIVRLGDATPHAPRHRGQLPDLEPPWSGVERWSPEKIARHRVVIDEQARFRTIDGGVLDTKMASASWRPNAELALFIMDPHGNFYVSQRRVASRIHHSTLSGGGPVAAAGELRVRDGQLLTVTDRSGHYPPTHYTDQIIVGELRERGVDVAAVRFDFAARN